MRGESSGTGVTPDSTLALARRLRREDTVLFVLWSLTTIAALSIHALGGALLGLTLFGHVVGVGVDPVAVLGGVADSYGTWFAHLG